MRVTKSVVGFVTGLFSVTVIVAGATAGPAGATPHATPPASPTIASVTAQLDTLARQSEQLAERFNAATIALGTVRARLQSAETAATAAAARRDAAQHEFVQLVQAQYEDGGGNAFGMLMTSTSRQGYLEQQGYADLAATHAANIISAYRQATVTAREARSAVAAQVKKVNAQVRALARARADAQSRTTKLQTLLDSLTAAQRAALAARDAATAAQVATVTATPAASTTKTAKSGAKKNAQHRTTRKRSTGSTRVVHAGSAAAQRAIDFALAQVGKPYSFGADGPGSYDCSGLTMAAWKRGGVNLPHLAAAQYDYGHHVSWDELQPGDLIFLYWPIGHVEIYIGNGMAVSAPQTGENVKIINIGYSRSQFHGATRLT